MLCLNLKGCEHFRPVEMKKVYKDDGGMGMKGGAAGSLLVNVTMVGRLSKFFNSKLKKPKILNVYRSIKFVKELFRVNPQSLQTLQLTGNLEFMYNNES